MQENSSSRLQHLFKLYLEGTITKDEYAELWELLQAAENRDGLSAPLQELWETTRDAPPLLKDEKWTEKLRHARTKQRDFFYRKLAAAVLVLIFGAAGYLLLKDPERPVTLVEEAGNADVRPGGNKAVLTLADGSTLVLDSASNGQVGQQGNVRIVKLDSGRLAYRGVNVAAREMVYNTLTTPRGGQFQLQLPDGSLAWLNAGSSIRFPNFFGDKERVVDVTGEVYFEIARDAQKPFIVHARGTRIDVLGTHFNIQAYDAEQVATTLLQGSVKVSRGAASMLLKPAQQALATENGGLQLVRDPDMDAVIAWKNGLFWLKDVDMPTLARQLSLWYDIDIVIQGHISQRFNGTIPRNVTVSRVFSVLQETGGLHYEIRDNRIIVSP
ncbi:FecR family protein [Chitinophaga cymbidii]|uniref:Iron dicitrate transporter FecR n=1 Tax=Chitinophaga cymbidii TaxID=1096750 RepID=A0A512RRG0_9BACT|nr:FecR family protein [Chitinophaga cymbidii]GEP98291.1 hypothetical protein CCY01nite_45510 [Chitinophaga cymbidii]